MLSAFTNCLAPLQAASQVANAWTNVASGDWVDPKNWSLGVAPQSGQTVFLTNAGFKAAAISSASSHPESLSIDSLVLSAPTNGFNTLLLNYAGLGVPLRIAKDCFVGTNAALMNLYSSLEVDSNNSGSMILDGGRFIQEGGLTVVRPALRVTNAGLYLTNAAITLGLLIASNNWYSTSVVYQVGGSIACDTLTGGTYHLVDGILYSIGGTSLGNYDFFNQYGGTNYGDVSTFGRYDLNGGLLKGNRLHARYVRAFVQMGGMVDMKQVEVSASPTSFSAPFTTPYALSNGVLRCSTLLITDNASFSQDGGEATVEDGMVLAGGRAFDVYHGEMVDTFARYGFGGGAFTTPSLVISNRGNFYQGGGTNGVANGLILYGGGYSMSNGLLTTAEAGIGLTAAISQAGGRIQIAGVLSITGTYARAGGELETGGIYLRGVLRNSRTNTGCLANKGLIDLGGTVQVSAPCTRLGAVRLSTNATVVFEAGAASVRFENSSGEAWSPGWNLTIQHWNPSPTNASRVSFGDNASGLTPAQLSQVRFWNPVGMPPGLYAAMLVTDGALAPAQPLPAVSGWQSSMVVNPYPLYERNVVALSSRSDIALAATADGHVVLWPQQPWYPPTPALSNVVDVAAGISEWYALLADGTVASWGYPQHGYTNPPPGLDRVVAISAGGASYALALREDGTIVSWGTEKDLWGVGNVPARAVPAIAIASGYLHNLALRPDGTVVAWGYNEYGQTDVPQGLSNVVAVACGDHFGMALKADGTIICWGQRSSGQCDVPPGLQDVVAIAGGNAFAMALRSDGKVLAWGENYYLQTNVPAWATNIVEIEADYNQALVVFAGGIRPQALLREPGFAEVPSNPGARAFTVKIPSRSGHVLRLEYADSPDASNWTGLPLVAARPGITVLTDPAPGDRLRFYRVRQW